MNRPSFDQYMLNLARVVATRATCSRLHVGAVLSRAGRVLSTGYNGAPAGEPHCRHVGEPGPCKVSVHAESNAIYQADLYRVPTSGAELFLTHSPCLACSDVLLAAEIRRVVFERAYRDDAGVRALRAGGVLVERLAA